MTPPECAPDLSNSMSAATYAVEEIAEAKDGFVRYFSDEEGMKTNSTRKKVLSILMFILHNCVYINLFSQETSTSAILTLWS